jgi:PKD repeat protein
MKKINLLFLAVVCLTSFFSATSQTITLGTATTTNAANGYPCPYGNSFWGAKHNFLVRASELSALGMAPGTINSISFNVANINQTTDLTNFRIGIKTTTAATITAAFGTGFSAAYGPVLHSVTLGWNTHVLTTPFFWDGSSNLLIETCFNNAAFVNGNPQLTYTSTPFQSASFLRFNNPNVCNGINGTVSTNRPNIQFTYTPSPIPPTTNFGANTTNTCQGTINFIDSSCCLVSNWAWDFGDSSAIDTTQNPVHIYANPGVYTVSLITTNQFGSDTLVKTNFITIGTGVAMAATCNPSATTPFGGFGITNVSFNTIANSSASANIGYEDFSCVAQTDVFEGSAYTLSVSATGAAGTQNFRAWIDFNNDGIFDTSAVETVLAVNNASSASALVQIPTGLLLNTPLRMRVVADYDFSANLPTPCGTFDYGQGEDYSVTILQNTNPPQTNFSVNTTTTCTGNVVFSDLSNNSPIDWFWNFGDGNTSPLQNPAHSYTASGGYTVSLITSNAFGADTLVLTNYVQVTLGVAPIAASCAPTTTLYCCGYGIFNVSFGTINSTTAAGIEGYQDLTCLNSTDVIEGFANLLSIQTGTSNAQDTRAWIDYNNDGIFSSGELVLTSNNQYNPSALVTVPISAAPLNTPLRMRIWTDFAGSTPGPCNNPNRGQIEDYTVVVKPNTAPPIAAFSADITVSCGGLVNFIDSSINTVNSWLWDFGDSSAVSTQQSPTHQYDSVGFYTVTLIVSSPYGIDTLVKTAYINVVSTTPGPITASCSPATTAYCCGIGISNVTFNTINNTTNDGVDSYSDYSCLLQTTISAGVTYPISVTTGTIYNENVRIWIDYNNDGSFNTTNEVVYSDFNNVLNHNGTISIPLTAVLNTPLRMRITSDNLNQLNTACTIPVRGQVEDYGIVILPNITPPIAAFTANTTLTCSGSVIFTNNSTNAASFKWYFGDSDSSSLLNPTHVYTSSGLYTVTLIATNNFGVDTTIISNYINVTLNNGPVNAICSPVTTSYCCGNGIFNVTLGNINNTTADGIDSYKDYSCSIKDTTLDAGIASSISITTGATQAENVRVYIDYNNNGNFNTSNELVYSSNALQTHNGNITVPLTGVAYYTNLRMRVMSDFLNINNSCTNVTFGQVEDYTVFIKNTVGNNDLNVQDHLSVYPNPSNGEYQINYRFGGKKTISVSVLDVLGRVAFNKQVTANSILSESIDMRNSTPGMYLVKIADGTQTITQKIFIE